MKAAITDYIEDEYEGNAADFAPTSKVVVDEDDRYVGSDKESREYSVPLEPIVIKSVKVKELLILFRTRRFAPDDKIKKDRFPRERGNGSFKFVVAGGTYLKVFASCRRILRISECRGRGLGIFPLFLKIAGKYCLAVFFYP